MPECAHSISDQPWNISANSQSMFAAGQPADLAAAPLLPSLGPPSFNTILLSLTGLLPRPAPVYINLLQFCPVLASPRQWPGEDRGLELVNITFVYPTFHT